MDVAAYLQRIGYRGRVKRDLETLTAIHRAHLAAIAYENLDIHLGRTLPLDAEAAFDKLVTRRRGGWCYEMNGLIAAVLKEIGFELHLAAGAVHREKFGDKTIGNHLVVIARLERPYLVDVGFGDGPLDPIPLQEGRYKHGDFEIGLERDGGWWRFRNHPAGGAPSFDFTEQARALDWFQSKCTELQTSPESGFVRASILQRRFADRVYVLRGQMASDIRTTGTTTRTVETQSDYARLLRDWFATDLGDDLARLWPVVVEKHRTWLAEQAAAVRAS